MSTSGPCIRQDQRVNSTPQEDDATPLAVLMQYAKVRMRSGRNKAGCEPQNAPVLDV
jgi:hypothetical protein